MIVRALAIVVAALLVASVALGLLWRHEHRVAAVARSAAVAAQAAQAMRTVETHTIVKYHAAVADIAQTAAPAIQSIQESPGAETPVSDDVLANWRNGINSLRVPTGGDLNPDSQPPQ